MKLLLAEDTADLNRVITAMLEMQHYDVDSVLDGEEASAKISENGYDAIILDIMMPKKDGLEVLKDLRAQGVVTPVLMLTAKAEVDDRVQGLDLGADDYLTKPFAMKELLARVRALTRRGTTYAAQKLSLGDVTLNAETLELTSENTVRLSLREFELMQTLLLNQDKTLSTAYLLEHVWKDEDGASGETVWLYINYLRRKLQYIDSNVTIEGERGGSFALTGPDEV